MGLVDSKLYFKTIQDDILQLLRNNKDILNENLLQIKITNKEKQIVSGYPGVYDFSYILSPMIFLKLVRKEETFTAIGNAGRKRPVLNFNIWGLIENDIKKLNSDTNILNLAMNLESIFRDNIQFSNNIVYSDLGTTDFSVSDVFEGGKYFDLFQTELKVFVEIK